jgi:hypothetical protein
MCQLLRRDLIAALAPVGVPNADIVVTDKIGKRLCAVQVKVRRDLGTDGGWHMSEKHEHIDTPNIFYCFVDFGKSLADHPKSWVIPSRVVAKALHVAHQRWLGMPGRNGRSHKDSKFRRFCPSYDHLKLGQYKLGWLDSYFEDWGRLEKVTKRSMRPS